MRGLALTPSQQQLVAASSDGRLSLLDMRRGGACICSTGLSTPVRCCLADEHLAAAGTAIGQVCPFRTAARMIGSIAVVASPSSTARVGTLQAFVSFAADPKCV